MSQTLPDYPPNPKNVPADLRELNWPYFLRVLLVLTTLTVFVAVYLGLLVGSGYLCYSSFRALKEAASPPTTQVRALRPGERPPPQTMPPVRISSYPIIVPIAGMITGGLLFLFLLKGFFKFRRHEKERRVEITEAKQPRFFAFLRQLCKDTGAAMPRRVFLVPDVNAAVTYENGALSLFMPTGKNLTVGLGLVNHLNVTELKAVLAHEFGHFSQASMKLGAYVWQANGIIADMVYGRDFFDDFLERSQGSDVRIDIFLKSFAAVIWTLRKGLEGLFHAINFANSSLSRQMEFNADLCALTVAGSDAIVHSLARLEYADASLAQAVRDLTDAGDHKLYTSDLFHHQTHAGQHLKKVKGDPKFGEVPPLPEDPTQTTQVFEPGDDGVPLMWKTHPSNFDREQNVKRVYVRGVIDDRSAWALFDDPESVRRRVTELHYQRLLVPTDKLTEPAKVQAFIDEEHAETTYPERYHGMYDDRYLDLVGFEMWIHAGLDLHDPRALEELHGDLYGPGIKSLMEKKKALLKEYAALQELAARGKPFTFRERSHEPEDAAFVLEEIEGELKEIDKRLEVEDRRVFQAHYIMVEQLGVAAVKDELMERYRFQASVQEILRKLDETWRAVQQVMGALSGQAQLDGGYFSKLIDFFQDAYLAVKTSFDTAAGVRIPRLKNMTEGQKLSEFLLTEPLLLPLSANAATLEGKWIDRLCQQMGEMLDRSRRLHFKSIGGILALHEQVSADWQDGWKFEQERLREKREVAV